MSDEPNLVFDMSKSVRSYVTSQNGQYQLVIGIVYHNTRAKASI